MEFPLKTYSNYVVKFVGRRPFDQVVHASSPERAAECAIQTHNSSSARLCSGQPLLTADDLLAVEPYWTPTPCSRC